jgi:hypothetical protein
VVDVLRLSQERITLHMYARASDMLETIARHYNAGDMVSACASFRFHLPVQIIDKMILFRSAAELAQGLREFQRLNKKMGLGHAVPRVRAIEIPRQGRFRLWVDWCYASGSSGETTGSQVIYYCVMQNETLHIDMANYVSTRAAQMRDFRPGRVRTA